MNITQLTKIKNGTRDRIRELVRIRDNHLCQKCGKKWEEGQRRFDVHHLDEEFESRNNHHKLSVDELDRKKFDRMITLCHKCHLSLPHIRLKMKLGTQKDWDKKKNK